MTQRQQNLSPLAAHKIPDADGLILLGKCPAELIPFLKNQYRSLIGIDRNPTNFDYDEIICDGTTAASVAMDYLILLGHKKIAYIGGCSYEARYIGYYQSLISHKLPLDHGNIYPTSQTREEGYQMMKTILKKETLPSAIFCANDSTALGVLEALKKSRRRKYIPSVISIDNIREAQMCSPSLTTIDIPKREMAHHAVALLLDRIRCGHSENIRMELPWPSDRPRELLLGGRKSPSKSCSPTPAFQAPRSRHARKHRLASADPRAVRARHSPLSVRPAHRSV